MGLQTIISSFEAHLLFYAFSLIGFCVSSIILIRSHLPEASRKRKIELSAIVVILLLSGIFAGWQIAARLSAIPTIESSIPASGSAFSGNPPTLFLTFTAPVDYRKLVVHIYPDTKLDIQKFGYLGGLLPFGRRLSITPTTSFPPGEKIMIYLSKVEGMLTPGFGGEHLVELMAPELPQIILTDPKDHAVDVPIDIPVSVTVKSQSTYHSVWEVESSPSHPLTVRQTHEYTFRIVPDKPFSQGVTYTLTLRQIPIIAKYSDGSILERLPNVQETKLTFTTIHPPLIKAFTPQGVGINPASEISLTFDQPMDTDSVERSLSVTPEINPQFVWLENNTILTLKNTNLTKDTTYSIKLLKGLKTQSGGVLESEAEYHFKTAGPVIITSLSPGSEATDIALTSPIVITFDQDIVPTLTGNLTISPQIPGKTSITGHTLTFTPDAPLSYGTKYEVTVPSGIGSVYGLPSTLPVTYSFTTQPYEVSLPVMYFKQLDLFTCNIAAARMLLSYRGITVSEDSLKQLIGFAGTRGNGNPNKGYVSDYGTYWDPIAKAISTYRPYRLITNGKLSDIINELKKGNPVMIWGQNGWSDPHEISWTASDGTRIYAINGMHSSVVRGFRGPDANPTHILLNDPWRGQYAIDTPEFLRRWGFFGIALVID